MMLENRNIGLVFSGGGGKGSYQIGVWRALEEFGVSQRVGAVAGTSVGALNAVLFKQGNLSVAEKIWLNLTTDDVLHITPKTIIKMLTAAVAVLSGMGLPVKGRFIARLAASGFFSREGLIKLSERYVDWDYVAAPGCDIHATALQVPLYRGGGVRHFGLLGKSAEHCLSVLLASSAIPVIFPTEVIDGKKHIDGGVPIVGCNTPVEAIVDQGHSLIIVVLMNRDDNFDPSCFSNTCILPIFPQEDQGKFFSGTLDFEGSHAARRIQQGYEDTRNILEPIYRMGKAQFDFSRALAIAEQQQAEWRVLKQTLVEETARLDGLAEENSRIVNDAIRRIQQ